MESRRGRGRDRAKEREGVGVGGASAIWSINYNNACNDVGHLIMLINLQAQFATVEASCKLLHVVLAVASCRCTLPLPRCSLCLAINLNESAAALKIKCTLREAQLISSLLRKSGEIKRSTYIERVHIWYTRPSTCTCINHCP